MHLGDNIADPTAVVVVTVLERVDQLLDVLVGVGEVGPGDRSLILPVKIPMILSLINGQNVRIRRIAIKWIVD